MSTSKNTVLYEDIIINAMSINLRSYFNINTVEDFTGEDLYYICFEPILLDRFGQVRYNILKKIGYNDYKKKDRGKLYTQILNIIKDRFIEEY